MNLLSAHPGVECKLAVVTLLLLAASGGVAQTLTTSSGQLCSQALADRGARIAIPVLASKGVRDSTCTCLASAVSERRADVLPRAAIEASVGECIAKAAPAEKVVPLPAAVLAQLEDAYATDLVARGYTRPTAKMSSCKLPEYPQASRMSEATGNTVLAFNIGANSRVLDGEVMRTAGSSPAHKLLDVTALFSLMQCRFEPARFRGQPIDAWTTVEYQWKLE
jgi:hypothetical protein